MLTIRNIAIGTPRPKVIVPIIDRTPDAILEKAKQLSQMPLDIIEWRADFYCDVHNKNALLSFLHTLRQTIQNTALLVTYRRQAEGGEGCATLAEYEAFCETIIESNCADALDIELSIGEATAKSLLKQAADAKLPTILSSHNFNETPSIEKMTNTLSTMCGWRASIAKLAVMPQTPTDTLALLQATAQVHAIHPETPLITMSMGEIGKASRVCGASFGSTMTFACIGDSSAPGQMELHSLNSALDALYGVKN